MLDVFSDGHKAQWPTNGGVKCKFACYTFFLRIKRWVTAPILIYIVAQPSCLRLRIKSNNRLDHATSNEESIKKITATT